ncbi:MAG: hypothetical protein NW223_13950 [Hyphomicrobiaceae bacterium]|nr:hypothetical protein [Hyphomicrobiaceae bacterium]
MEMLKKAQPFFMEMVVGALIGIVGLSQFVYGYPPVFNDPELLRKFAASLITVGGTVIASGFFRFVFSLRLDNTEARITGELDGIRLALVSAISKVLPGDLNVRPQYQLYCYLYWRTIDQRGEPRWLQFSELKWKKQVLPFLEADATIDDGYFNDNHSYRLAMVELPGCIVIAEIRDGNNNEMAGINFFPIPIAGGPHLFGHLRHMHMGGKQCLSPCVLSRERLDVELLDTIWLDGDECAGVVYNLPSREAIKSMG